MESETKTALAAQWYEQYVDDRDHSAYLERIAQRYSLATLERLALGSTRMARRGAVLALGALGDYAVNPVLGRALQDCDRGVRLLADHGIRLVWRRDGSEGQCQLLDAVVHLNAMSQHEEACELATELIQEVASFAEAWNQRAIAYYCLDRFVESIHDCRQTLEINPFHFAAASGMGQCYLKLGDPLTALECYQQALALNPTLEDVRANIIYLQRTLKRRL